MRGEREQGVDDSMEYYAALLLILKFKNWKKKFFGLVVFIVLVSLPYVIQTILKQNSEKSDQPRITTINQNIFNSSDTSLKIDENAGQVAGTNSKNKGYNINEWKIAHYDNITDDGFLCPSSWSTFSSPEIWNIQPIPVNFRRISVSFEIRNKKTDDLRIPTFIFSLGSSTRILRFYTPQKTKDGLAQYVGLQKIKPPIECKDPWGECNWDPPQSLKEPIATGFGRLITLQIDTQYMGDNFIGYVFTLLYPSALTFKKMDEIYSYNVVIPAPDPSTYMVEWGVGTFKESCFRISSYSVDL